jgi:hypothetical protein
VREKFERTEVVVEIGDEKSLMQQLQGRNAECSGKRNLRAHVQRRPVGHPRKKEGRRQIQEGGINPPLQIGRGISGLLIWGARGYRLLLVRLGGQNGYSNDGD